MTARPSAQVLVVDDDVYIRETMADVLRDEGYAVQTACHGVAALEWLASCTPALILLDVNMPVMNGMAFRRIQLADARLASIPTVIVSAIDRLGEYTRELAADRVLAKPVGLDELLAVVEQLTRRRG